MSYDNKASQFDKEHIWIIEMDLESCTRTYGSSPCLAGVYLITVGSSVGFVVGQTITGSTSGAVGVLFQVDNFLYFQLNSGSVQFTSGETVTTDTASTTISSGPFITTLSTRCFNTFETCQYISAYNGDTNLKTYRFCSEKSPQPLGLEAIPIVSKVEVASGIIDPNGGLGIRSNVNITMTDLPGSDIGIDPYPLTRSYDPYERGLYGTKLRARNPNYQYRPLRALSGYLNEDQTFQANNFKTRFYVIDSLDASGGMIKIKGKDPLKLATMNKAQVPKPNSGQLTGVLLSSSTSFGVATGDGAQYAASGWLVIDREVMSFTRSTDTFTVVRGQYNTAATGHSNDATVQQCYVQTGVNVDIIVADLLLNFCGIDPAFIDLPSWASESNIFLNENMNGIITKPTDVFKELKLLAKSAPHYLWWDEISAKIRFTALKAPPLDANLISEDLILENKFKVSDSVEKRVSTVFINFGQLDPTLKLDEENNYQISYVRTDVDSIAKYGSDLVEKINTRWIGTSGKSAAIKIATLIGRRFANIPREATWQLDPRYRLGLGGSAAVNHRDMVDFTGLSKNVIFQILDEKENENSYTYSGLEFAYGREILGDSEVGTDTVFISINEQNVNAADKYIEQIGAITGDIVVRFIVDANVVVGSSSTGTYGFDLGNWGAATSVDITLELSSGALIIGRGGNGADVSGTPTNGGPAINLTENITLINNSRIGGGGAGGDWVSDGAQAKAAGGGGAGSINGLAGTGTTNEGATGEVTQAQDGSNEDGGNGGTARVTSGPEPFSAFGEAGGDLGQSRSAATAGAAINLNGNAITYTLTGTISGTVS
jgi:hypothetical protein